MRIDFSGVHIETIKSETIQRSATQDNAIAFITDDGVWIHIPLKLLSELAAGATRIKQLETQNNPFV